jgi:hypothetical protein
MTEIFRIEGSGVDPNITQGLAAEIADPLWYLARQWQLGEFRGEDAASPVIVEAVIDCFAVDGLWVDPGQPPEPAPQGSVPLEALVERETADLHYTPRTRLESGAALLRRLRRAGVPPKFGAALQATYRIRPDRAPDDGDALGRARLAVLAAAAFDGRALAQAVEKGGSVGGLPELAALDPADQSRAIGVMEEWLAEEAAIVVTAPDALRVAWQDRAQEYRFGISASVPGADPIRLAAPEYPGGLLDWQHFDYLDGPKALVAADSRSVRMLASPLEFAGQPAARWWEMEEGVAYFGDLAGGAADLARSVLAAYAAVAGDDWFVLPCQLPAGTLSRVKRLRVLDNFGDWTSLRSCAAVDAAAGNDRVWRWFELTGNVAADPEATPLLFVPPVLGTTRQGNVLEEVHFRRDEMANLSWAIELSYQGALDRPVARLAPLQGPAPEPAVVGDWTYQLGSVVPANWVPLVPVRIDAGSPQIVLRRGRMVQQGGSASDGTPKGALLRPGQPFLLNEAEVPLGGTQVTRRYQMARSADGGTHLWCARRKIPSTGAMTHSPLDFDALRLWPKAP